MAPKFDVYAHVTETIIAEIEAGTLPWRKPWTGSASGIALPTRHNGEEYRGINILMLWVMAAKHGCVSSRWMTYKQAQELGGQVRKGETSSTVVKYRDIAFRCISQARAPKPNISSAAIYKTRRRRRHERWVK
ncbi:MAG: ArdC family protein [Paracoccaceae bacterium]